MPTASRPKAISIVFSRPILSDTQPKNGRVTPFKMRSIDNAKVRAGKVMPIRLTGTSSILKSLAIGASCAVAIKPPAPTSTNMTYMTQKIGDCTIRHRVYDHQEPVDSEPRLCCRQAGHDFSVQPDDRAVQGRAAANAAGDLRRVAGQHQPQSTRQPRQAAVR